MRLALGFGARLQRGTLDVTLPDGRVVRLGGNEPGPSAAMKLYNYGFASRLLNGGDIGIAEAYLRGEWDTPDLTQFLYLFCVNHDLIQPMLADKPLMRSQMVRHWFNRNTRRQARRNIYAHYDIGNAFYSAWLDPSMTYSSALFEDDTADLTAAQNNKYRRLAEALDLQPGQKLLEIGCGWGGFAEYAAKTYGASGRPHHQRGAARFRASAHPEGRPLRPGRNPSAGLSRRARPVRPDRLHRDDRGRRRAVLAELLLQFRDRLLPGGLAGIQAITIRDSCSRTIAARSISSSVTSSPAACCPRPIS